MGFTYKTEHWLPYPVEALFAFFANPDNLPLLIPAWQRVRIEKASIVPAPGSLGSKAAGIGSRITFSFRPFPLSPVRVRWEAEITELAWNNHFCDTQVRGPFAHWHHCHYLRDIGREGVDLTVIVDRVEYDTPFGRLGRLAHRMFLQRQIERTFAFRKKKLSEIFAGMKLDPSLPHPQRSPGKRRA
jgi:ligand-binding SRPBCC domain-containing protein